MAIKKPTAPVAKGRRRIGEPGAETADTPPKGGRRRRPGLHMRIGTDGAIEVRHGADSCDPLWGEAVALSDAVEMRDAAPVWIQVAKVGQFAGHPAGPFRLGEKEFGEIVANFQTTQNRRVPIDFEHASEAEPTAGAIPTDGAPAQGWIVDLDNRGSGGLWALVEWGDKAREYIRAGQYRYISPAVRFNSKDRVTGQPIGARLTSAGLTNQPFLDGMQPLAAKDHSMLDAPMMRSNEFMPACRAALSLHELATHAECKDQLERLRDMCGLADDPMGIHEGVDLGGYVSRLRALMTMPAHTTLGELLNAVDAMINTAIARHEADYHEDDGVEVGPVSEPMSAMTDTNEGDSAMADTKTLKDLELERDGALAKLKDKDQENAGLSLRLKDAEAKAGTLEAEVAKLRDEAEKRAEADATSRIDEAFAAYKDAKKLTDDDKAAMRVVLSSNAPLFERLYPRIAPNHQHLLRNLSGQQIPGPTSQGQGSAVTMSHGRRPDVPDHVAPPAPQATVEGVQRGRALQALSKGLAPEQAVLMAMRGSTPTA